MAAPPIAPTRRYLPPGIRKVYYVPVIANYLLPSRAELNSGLDLTAEIPEGGMTGWSLAGSTVDVADMGSKFTSQVIGRLTSATNTIDQFLDQGANDVRKLLPRNTVGYIVHFPEGDVTGQLMDIFPVQVLTQAIDTNSADPGKVSVEFAITRLPAISVTIP